MIKTSILALSAFSMVAIPVAADAHPHHRYNDEDRYSEGYDRGYDEDRGDDDDGGYRQERYGYGRQNYGYDNGYRQQAYDNGYYGRSYGYRGHRCSGTTGTIVGGGAGALLGRSLGRGSGYYHQHSGATGTILGGVLGALAGRQVGKSTC